jgi:hypothetical protein
LRRSRGSDTNANTFSDPNRDRYANGHSHGNSYANWDGDAWTDPAQGRAEKGWGNKYGASRLEGGDLA